MMAGGGNGGLTVPPGFRFHPTDEELLYYYLKKKVSYEPIDFDVIREVDLNKLEPWDLKEKCRIGSGPQNEWYLFSHKDKKYPTGTRTNRATAAGFWKATGRDKAIHMSINSRRIGMRKTLVFYTGRAPHGHKTDWIMHEYRLDDDNNYNDNQIQEDGWVICRVFKKKNHTRGFHPEMVDQEEFTVEPPFHGPGCSLDPNLTSFHHQNNTNHNSSSMHLPQLMSPESSSFSLSSLPLTELQNHVLRLTTTSTGTGFIQAQQQEKMSGAGDWSFLDKLVAGHQSIDQITKCQQFSDLVPLSPSHTQRFPFQYQGSLESDFTKCLK